MAPMPIFDNGDCSASLTGCVEKGPHGAKFAVASDKFKELQEKDPRQLVEDAKDYAKKIPAQTILISAAVGLVVGWLLKARR